jgi:F-type H+-transporting ATPase subunit delta
LFRFARTMEQSDELRDALTKPELPPEKRQAVVEDLLGSKGAPLAAQIVSFLVGAGRARELPQIVDRMVQRAAEERQHALAEVRSAIPLDDEQRRRLAKALSSSVGREVEVKVVVDPSVLGGLVARVGDTVIDGTVRHRLDQLRESF